MVTDNQNLNTPPSNGTQAPPVRNPAPEGLDCGAVADVSEVLHRLSHTLVMVNSGLAMKEAVHGLRMFEPRNDLIQELKELHWCIAVLNGMTTQPCPAGDDLIEASVALRCLETARLNPLDGLSR